MTDIASSFSRNYFSGKQLDENLAEAIRDLLKKEGGEKYFSEHYNLTELCNPQKSYWNRKSPGSEIPKKLELMWRRGTKLHNFAGKWFQGLPNFLVSEATLDGFDVGIPGVIGRFDFKFGNSIVEFKTKEGIPKTPEEIISLFPQDLEQLLFYSVMHIKHPLVNYLVFMEDKGSLEIRAFKVEIKNLESIKTLLEERKAMLDLALKTNNPISLGRCRYYNGICEVKAANKCNCEVLRDLPVNVLKDCINLTFDEKMTQDLIESREKSKLPSELFTINEIIAPRKSFIRKVLGEESDYVPNEVLLDRKDCLNTLINRLQKYPTAEEMKLIEGSLKEKRLYIGKKWLKLSSTKHPEGIFVPYLIKADSSYEKHSLSNPGQYNLAELSIICAAYGKGEGLIFKIFPNLDNAIQVFKINFKDLGSCLNKIRSVLDNLGKVKKPEDICQLPPCPFYMNSKKDCSMTDGCHNGSGEGCLRGYVSKEKVISPTISDSTISE